MDRSDSEQQFDLEISFLVKKKQLGNIIDRCIRVHGTARTAEVLDRIKAQGLKYSTRSGLTVAVVDAVIPVSYTHLDVYKRQLLPHLAKDQMVKPMTEGIRGEQLNVVVGSRPYQDEKVKEKVKLNVLSLLHEKYGLVESDFLSAELTMVPAGSARDVGFDRSMVGAYGQDDKVCAYTSPVSYTHLDVYKRQE